MYSGAAWTAPSDSAACSAGSDDGTHCLKLFGTGQLDEPVYWLIALDVEFDVLDPPLLKERLRQACEEVGRCLMRGGG
jgi:hypothetical protein